MNNNNNTTSILSDDQETNNSNFKTASVVCGLILLLVFLCSFAISTCVLWALWKTKQLQCPVNRIIAFLLVDEVLIRIFGSPLIITSLLASRWLYTDYGCVFYGFLMTWLGVTATSLYTCVAIERYIVMCRPNIRQYVTTRTADVTAILCYLHGLVWASVPLIRETTYVYEPSGISCTPDWAPSNIGYILGLSNVCFVMPVALSIFCYTSIFITLRKKRRERVTLHHDATVEKHVAVTMMITLFAFLFTWTPYAVIGLNKTVGLGGRFPIAKELTLIPLVTAKTSGFWNAFVFSFRNREVHKVIADKMEIIKSRLSFKIVRRQRRNQVMPRGEKCATTSTIRVDSERLAMFQVSMTSAADNKLIPRAPTSTCYTIMTTM